jgi:hypothetical protein
MRFPRRKACLAILVACLGLVGRSLAEDSDKKEFTSKEGSFKILFPAAPQEQEQTIRSPVGPLVNRVFFCMAANNETVYLVSFANYPDEPLKQYTPEQILNAARNGTVENLKGKLVSEQKLTLDKTHPGLEFVIEVPNTAQYRARIYFANKRLYQVVLVTSPKVTVSAKEIEDYFESFKLIGK